MLPRLTIILLFLFIHLRLLFSQNDQNKLFFVITKDGTENIGNILSENETSVTLRSKNQEIIFIPKTDIKLFEPVTEDNFYKGKYIHPNLFANRYIIGSSAIGPGKNKLFFKSIYGLAETLDYGITDEYSAGLSTSIVGVPVLLNGQANYKITDGLYLGGTATGGWLGWAGDSVFFGYGGIRLTKGTRSNNYTIGGGYFSLSNSIVPARRPSYVSLGDFGYLNFSSAIRFTRRISGLSEIWIMKNIYFKRSIYAVNLGIKIQRRVRKDSFGEKSAWTFFVSTIAFQEPRQNDLTIKAIPCVSWSKKIGKN